MSTDTATSPPADPPADKTNTSRPRWLVIAIAAAAWIGWAVAAVEWYYGDRSGPPPIPPVETLPQKTDVPAEVAALAIPLDYEGAPYEAPGFEIPGHEGHDHEALAATGDGRPLPTKSIPYWIDYSGAAAIRPALSRDAIRQATQTAWRWISESVDLAPYEVADESKALFRHRFGRIDGTNGTLAWSYLSNGTMQPIEQKYDISERWTAGSPAPGVVSMPTVMAHEILHGLGLGHDDPNAPALLRPSYTASIPREQPRDIDRLFRLGYAKRQTNAGTELLTFEVTASARSIVDKLKAAGWKIEEPNSP